jgi:CHASE3 domain sensor protein
MDGLSVAATIIGVVSFGLTVCQGLVAYYANFADANEDVARLLRSMSQLTNNPAFLEETISGSKNFNSSSITTAEKCIHNCQNSIDRLN